MAVYLDQPKQWDRVIKHILDTETVIGWDTEYDGVDYDAGDNPVGRSRLDVWSIALFDGGFHPRGYRTAKGCVLPRDALHAFRPVLENQRIRKIAHNASADIHTAYNSGVDAQCVTDTLNLLRWLIPGLLKYGLDYLAKLYLDQSKFMSFRDLCGELIHVLKEIEVKVCSCGEDGCRKRKGHEKTITIAKEWVPTKKYSYIPISDIGPDHPKWKQKLDYAAQDAVLALCLYDWAVNQMKAKNYDNPFIQATTIEDFTNKGLEATN